MQKRLFLALQIKPEEVIHVMYSNLKSLWREHKINWVPLNHLHLTFHFFGDTDENLIPAIAARVKDSVSNIAPFEIIISRLGIFGSSYKPRVLWMGIEPDENIDLLSQQIATHLSKIGYIPDRQNFVPHLTLGRIKFIDDKKLFQKQLDVVKNTFFQVAVADRIILFESLLSTQGATYQVIETFPFGGKNSAM